MTGLSGPHPGGHAVEDGLTILNPFYRDVGVRDERS